MTTADRIDPVGYRAWAPTVVVTDKKYIGRHRLAGMRTVSVRRMMYTARHVARER